MTNKTIEQTAVECGAITAFVINGQDYSEEYTCMTKSQLQAFFTARCAELSEPIYQIDSGNNDNSWDDIDYDLYNHIKTFKAHKKHRIVYLTPQQSDVASTLEMAAKIDALEANLAEVIKDAERLEWLNDNFFTANNLLDDMDKRLNKEKWAWLFFAPIGIQSDIRIVLDEAIKKDKQ